MKAFAALTLFLATSVVSAQRPASAPETAPSGKPPDTVMMEDLTWAEVRDLVKAGWTNVIVGTAGTEQKGPHMVDGEHKFVMTYAADQIARGIGRTFVAPIVTYVPEGSWDTVGGHMGKPGTITLPEDRFVDLLVSAGRSLKAGGFTNVLFVGESGGNRTGMRSAAGKLNALWQGSGAKAYWVDDYYTKAHREQETFAAKFLGVPEAQVGNHANLLDTSELLFVAPQHIRRDRLVGNDYDNNGVSGVNQSKSSPEVGRQLLQIKIDNALAQVKRMMSGTEPPVPAAPQQGGGGGGAARAAASAPAGPPRPTMDTAPAGKTPTRAPDTVFIDELTWEETRDALKAGSRRVIIPTGGTEKNGYHMVLGKHNFIVAHGANLMARRLGQTLVAPVIQYVPEGDPDRQVPGAISLPSPAYDQLLDAAARSLKAHGFNEILFIGDSGGNQAALRAVAEALNTEWKDAGVKVFALTDYYEGGREHYRAWMEAAFGYDDTLVGSHAGISDTSQMLYVYPSGVRKDQIMPWGGPKDSGVTGDPVKATAEIGRMGIEFKVNAGIGQYRLLKNPPQQRQRPSGQ
ncbi:MAG TPA: creatininase family protein [Vicinamibacterales bacterium]|nr:creatininase family protein [Vicinamibacterales bacterium]